MTYEVLTVEQLKNSKQYKWFRTFPNPCYGVTVKMDVTELVRHCKTTGTSFFINTLYLVARGLSSVEELRLREVRGQIRLYEDIDPAFTVMTDGGFFENAHMEMSRDYSTFYDRAQAELQRVKGLNVPTEGFNKEEDYAEYYMTCVPWMSLEDMSHPLPAGNYESLSCPRVCWDRYREEDGRLKMILNLTVNHCFVDGYRLSFAYKEIQRLFDKAAEELK